MPISKEKRALYPPAEWKKIREAILARARNRCEWCGRPNGEIVAVLPCGCWALAAITDAFVCGFARADACHLRLGRPHDPTEFGFGRFVKTVLTIAHVDRDPRNNAPENLAATCQRCHLRRGRRATASAESSNSRSGGSRD